MLRGVATLMEIKLEKNTLALGFEPKTFWPAPSCRNRSVLIAVGQLQSHQIGPKLVACAPRDFGSI